MEQFTTKRTNEREVKTVPYTPSLIIPLCDADYCAVSENGQIGRDVFTVADLEEMKGEE